MSNADFDIMKLKQLCDIDIRDAVKNFGSYGELFEKLAELSVDAKEYLADYSSVKIMNDEDKRDELVSEIKEIKSKLISLGIMRPISTLSDIDYEVKRSNGMSVDQWLEKFRSEMALLSKNILASQTNSEPPPAPAAPEPVKPLILATDDKPEILTAVVGMLDDKFKVMATTSGQSALRLMAKHTPSLFLLDIEMPVMDGYELAEAIRQQEKFKTTPIIFLTSKNTRSDVISAIKRGGNDYLVKPVAKNLLLSKIMQHLNIIP